jgi:uncharacterized delta-60 repeat protein
VGLKKALIGFAVLFAATAGAALAADPTDMTFGTNGIAEIEARVPENGQVGGIVDLEPGGGGKLLAAVYPIARGGHYFAAARIRPNGRLDRGFGRDGFTAPFRSGRGEVTGGGHLQAEAVARQEDGKVLLAGYRDFEGSFAPALARFTKRGRLDRSFGHEGKVLPRPSHGGRRAFGQGGGGRIHDVAIQPDGTIVGVGDVIPHPRNLPVTGPKRAGALVIAYRPDGRIDRDFAHRGRLRITPLHNGPYSGYTGFTQVKALPSGKLLVSGYIHQRYVLYRLTADGRIDRSFGSGGRFAVAKPGSRAVIITYFFEAPFAVDPQGRIVLCAPLFPGGFGEPVGFLRLLPGGRRDTSFGRSIHMERAPIDTKELSPREHGVQFFSFEPLAVTVDGHGRILVTGGELAPYTRGQEEPGHEDFTSRRFLPNGHRDPSFGQGGVWHTDPPGSQSLARAALTQPDGKVVAGGWAQIERFGGNGPGNTAMMLTRYRQQLAGARNGARSPRLQSIPT